MHKSQRKERELKRTRRDILEAAARAFVRKGYHGTTMEEVAHEAEYSVASLYTYFKGKESLYLCLLETIAKEFQATYDEPALPSLGFRERFAWLLHRQFELVEQNREFFVVFCQMSLGERTFVDVTTAHQTAIVDRMEAFISTGIRDGVIRVEDARTSAYFVLGAVRAIALRWLSAEEQSSLSGTVATVLDLILSGLGAQALETRVPTSWSPTVETVS